MGIAEAQRLRTLHATLTRSGAMALHRLGAVTTGEAVNHTRFAAVFSRIRKIQGLVALPWLHLASARGAGEAMQVRGIARTE
jgi:hypothetical protein